MDTQRIPSHLNIFRRSILSVRVRQARNEQLFDSWSSEGTGSVVHADEKRTIILTAAHVVLPEEVYFERLRCGLDPLSTNLDVQAKVPGGKTFTARCLPITSYLRDIAFLEADTASIGEVLHPLAIASGHDASLRTFWAIGYQSPEEQEGRRLSGFEFRPRVKEEGSFFYLPGDLPHGYSGGPLFELEGASLLGIIRGSLHTGSSIIYGPTYDSIRKSWPL